MRSSIFSLIHFCLQVNLSHNRLSGGVPAQLAILAAVRPVMVTMKDG
jgi:hypothetical protein